MEEGVTGGVSGAPTVELRGQSVATDCQWISGSWAGDTEEAGVDQEQERGVQAERIETVSVRH